MIKYFSCKKVELLSNFYHTVRHLSYRQIFFQIKSRLTSSRVRLKKSEKLHLNTELVKYFNQLNFTPRWTGGDFDANEIRFDFIGQSVEYADGVDWGEDRFGGLWLDHLHYFRFLDLLSGSRQDVQTGFQLIRDWKSNRLSVQKAFWPAYNASERSFCMGRWLIVNHAFLDQCQIDELMEIIYQDISFVNENLEWNLDGNHLLKNISAVWWGCYLFDQQNTLEWRNTIDKHLKAVVKTQILEDGLHYEKSPLYHQLALIDFLDILVLMPAADPEFKYLSGIVNKMFSALRLLIHPDGRSCMFGDSPSNLSAPASMVLNFCRATLGSPKVVYGLANAGYYQLSRSDEFYIIADTGHLGPDEQMGHAHSDMLHFEMSYLGERVLVEGGTSSYYDEVRRPYERSTRAHNTVSINGNSQCQNWSNFRVANRGYCRVISYVNNKDYSILEAQHDGFKKKFGLIHRRKFISKTDMFIIEDAFDITSGSVNLNVIDSFLHFSKESQLHIIDGETVAIDLSNNVRLYLFIESASFEIIPMQYGVGYNVLEVGKCIKLNITDATKGARYCFSGSLKKLVEFKNISD